MINVNNNKKRLFTATLFSVLISPSLIGLDTLIPKKKKRKKNPAAQIIENNFNTEQINHVNNHGQSPLTILPNDIQNEIGSYNEPIPLSGMPNDIINSLRELHQSEIFSKLRGKLPDCVKRPISLNLNNRNINDNDFQKLLYDIDTIPGMRNRIIKIVASRNNLTSIPQKIVLLRNLQCLRLNNNQITAIPESIGQLQNLQFLHLYNNLITAIPESIGQLKSLQFLDLHNNPIANPDEKQRLNRLLPNCHIEI